MFHFVGQYWQQRPDYGTSRMSNSQSAISPSMMSQHFIPSSPASTSRLNPLVRHLIDESLTAVKSPAYSASTNKPAYSSKINKPAYSSTRNKLPDYTSDYNSSQNMFQHSSVHRFGGKWSATHATKIETKIKKQPMCKMKT